MTKKKTTQRNKKPRKSESNGHAAEDFHLGISKREIEHKLDYWRRHGTSYRSNDKEVRLTIPSKPAAYPEQPLRDLFLLLHDYLTEIAKFLKAELASIDSLSP